jgi:hypothetical protein
MLRRIVFGLKETGRSRKQDVTTPCDEELCNLKA